MLANDGATFQARLASFHTASLRKILRIFWPWKISNDELLKQTKQEDIGTLVTRRRLRWIGHVLRKGNNNIAGITLMRWTPVARFSKLPVITGPVKLFCFPFQIRVSKALNIIQ